MCHLCAPCCMLYALGALGEVPHAGRGRISNAGNTDVTWSCGPRWRHMFTCFSCFSVLKPFWNHKFWSPYEANLGQLRSTFWFSGCFVAQLWHRMVRRAAIRWAGPCCGWSVALGLRAVTNKHGVGWLDEVGRRWWNGVFEYIWVNMFCTTLTTLTTLPIFQFLRGFWSVIGQITTETEKTCQSELLPVWTLILMYQ